MAKTLSGILAIAKSRVESDLNAELIHHFAQFGASAQKQEGRILRSWALPRQNVRTCAFLRAELGVNSASLALRHAMSRLDFTRFAAVAARNIQGFCTAD